MSTRVQALKYVFLLLAVFGTLGYYVVTTEKSPKIKPATSSKVENTVQTQKEPITPDTVYLKVNESRIKNGLQPFARNNLLDKSASLKCEDMRTNNYYSHNNPVNNKAGASFPDDTGVKYKFSSENLNKGRFTTNQEIIDSWMGSPSHKASILNPAFTEIGFAVCDQEDYKLIVLHEIQVPDPVPQVQYVPQQQAMPSYNYTVPKLTPDVTTCNTTNTSLGYSESYSTTCRSY